MATTCSIPDCGKSATVTVPVRDHHRLHLCGTCMPVFATALKKEKDAVAAQQAAKPIAGYFGNIDTNRTFDNILKRVFGTTYDRLDANARAQVGQFFHAPVTHENSVVGWFENMAREMVSYALAKCSGPESDAIAKATNGRLENMGVKLVALVRSSFTGSERDKVLAKIGKERADAVGVAVNQYIALGVGMVNSGVSKDAPSAASNEAEGLFTNASDELSYVIGTMAGDNIAKRAAVSCAMDSLQHALIDYVKGIKCAPRADDMLQMGPKRVQTVAIKAGQAIAAIVPPNAHCRRPAVAAAAVAAAPAAVAAAPAAAATRK